MSNEELLSNVKIELEITGTEQDALLTRFINKASKKVVKIRHPYGCTEEQKEEAIEQYEDNITDIVVFMYNKMGAEGELSHSENGVYRTYKGDGIPYSFTSNIVPFVKAF